MQSIFTILSNTYTLFSLTDRLKLSFRADGLGVLFFAVSIVVFLLSFLYAIWYMKGKENKTSFFVFFLLSELALIGMGFAENFFTFYLFYELLTLFPTPLVLHDRTREAIKAGVKYLLYSLFGAYCVLFGFFVLNDSMDSLSFSYSGLSASGVERTPLVLVAIFMMLIGFGVKAGMWPLHAWLVTAHPQAPSPASAVLSGMIAKAGVLGIVRTIFFFVGPDTIRGTWVQYAWMGITLLTVFMGSMMAYKETLLKCRLAYSTVSQISYILFGLSIMNEEALNGSLLQFLAHAFSKCALFLVAGVLIHVTGKTNVSEYKGIGRKYPLLLWCYLIASLSLIGIPPTGGFYAKWDLCIGSLNASSGFLNRLGPVILLVSALLTAGYLLPIALRGFFAGEDFEDTPDKEKIPLSAMIPIVLLALLCIVTGVFSLNLKIF